MPSHGLFIVMELLEGSLAGLVKRYRPISEQMVAKYTAQILNALEYLHKNGIVHRDIKVCRNWAVHGIACVMRRPSSNLLTITKHYYLMVSHGLCRPTMYSILSPPSSNWQILVSHKPSHRFVRIMWQAVPIGWLLR